MASGDSHNGKGMIRPAVNDGPYATMWEVDGVLTKVLVNQANLAAAYDSLKTLVGTLPGQIKSITVSVVSREP